MTISSCGILAAAVGALATAGVEFALVHESALMGWGIDYGAFLDAVDVLIVADDGFDMVGCEMPHELGSFAETTIGGAPARLWSKASLGLPAAIEVTSCPRYGCEALAPEFVLAKLPYSPDAPLLVEQRARLAAILAADELNEKQLALVAAYVRGD